ncbi:DUF551 domain-containing protein [Achromobacter spanius]|uniref:DUF551 domain-containing protein n=1 Tax=Achromobacter spanius TaxID=217203 RepID=UPI003208FCBB
MNTEWKPIESAPKDGTEVWAYNGEQARMRWTEGECYALWIWADDLVSDADPCPDQPTHWMPLPPAPTSHPIPTGATGEDGRSATYGMTLGERIAHVGGRTNAQSYTEFGSPMAVNALIQHVLRDLDWTRQDDDGAYQARYRLPGGEWSSWGHVVCGVKGHEQELRYLPGERRPSPAAGDALDSQAIAALRLALKYWEDRQQRYKNRSPAWVEASRAAIAQQKGEA